ncbi:MAG TPA: hypothetical protein VNM67_24875 [Thermoanaerobaculia bacterium]|jgi:hypothetical protein|nr:hypothetical protein [Thermoanaerobaculia bacterium]
MEAKDCGELEARAFDLHLRALESREREDRLTRLVAERPDLSAAPVLSHAGDSPEVERLRREVGLFAQYHHALLRSKGWRLVQTLRRPFGRAW